MTIRTLPTVMMRFAYWDCDAIWAGVLLLGNTWQENDCGRKPGNNSLAKSMIKLARHQTRRSTRSLMRTSAKVALVIFAASAGFGAAGCTRPFARRTAAELFGQITPGGTLQKLVIQTKP